MPNPFVFVGGPHDGQRYEHSRVTSVAEVMPPIWTESGNRVFLLLPSLEDCESIVRGEMRKPGFAKFGEDEAKEQPKMLFPYERVPVPTGGFEYRYDPTRLTDAMQERNAPLSDDAIESKSHFGALADEFTKRFLAAPFDGATEVYVMAFCVNDEDLPLSPFRIDLVTTANVTIPGDQIAARQMAISLLRDSVVSNIDSLVRNAPTGRVSIPGHASTIQYRNFEMVIEQA